MRTFQLLTLAVLSRSAVAAVVYSIPDAYLGHWGASAAACTTPTEDPLHILIERGRVVFPESVAYAAAVVTDGPRGLSLALRSTPGAVPSAGAELADQLLVLTLSQDGQQLSTMSEGKVILTRTRCAVPSD